MFALHLLPRTCEWVVVEGNSEIKFIGRILDWNKHRFYWTSDIKLQVILLGEWCLECCNGVCTPAASAEQCEGYIVEMQDVEAIAHRRNVVRLTYLAQDRRGIALSANTLARTLIHPKVREVGGMKRVIQYLRTHRLNFLFQEMSEQMIVLSDIECALYTIHSAHGTIQLNAQYTTGNSQ